MLYMEIITMRKRLEKENRSFIEEWGIIRKKGSKNYIISKTVLLAVMMLFIYNQCYLV